MGTKREQADSDLKCSECGIDVGTSISFNACDECGLIDVCLACIQDHRTEQHEDSEENEVE